MMKSSWAPTWFVVLVALTVMLLIQATPAPAQPTEILGPGDNIRVTVFQNPDLTTETRISPEGSIRMPLVGDIDLKGLSPGEAVARIAQRYKDGKFLKNPEIGLAVLQVRSRQVSVLGQVAHPGRYALDDTSTKLTDVLALAGGITQTGDDIVSIITARDGKPSKLAVDVSGMVRNADMAANIEIQNGDTIFVQRAPMFYIYGEVQRAGAYRVEKDLNVVQAISLGGGVTLRGTERGIKINRRGTDGNLTKIEAHPADKVQPDDIIYVRESLF